MQLCISQAYQPKSHLSSCSAPSLVDWLASCQCSDLIHSSCGNTEASQIAHWGKQWQPRLALQKKEKSTENARSPFTLSPQVVVSCMSTPSIQQWSNPCSSYTRVRLPARHREGHRCQAQPSANREFAKAISRGRDLFGRLLQRVQAHHVHELCSELPACMSLQALLKKRILMNGMWLKRRLGEHSLLPSPPAAGVATSPAETLC